MENIEAAVASSPRPAATLRGGGRSGDRAQQLKRGRVSGSAVIAIKLEDDRIYRHPEDGKRKN